MEAGRKYEWNSQKRNVNYLNGIKKETQHHS